MLSPTRAANAALAVLVLTQAVGFALVDAQVRNVDRRADVAVGSAQRAIAAADAASTAAADAAAAARDEAAAAAAARQSTEELSEWRRSVDCIALRFNRSFPDLCADVNARLDDLGAGKPVEFVPTTTTTTVPMPTGRRAESVPSSSPPTTRGATHTSPRCASILGLVEVCP